MVLERGLAAAGDEDHLLDPGLERLLDRILDERPVDDGQHLLGDRLGRGQEARAEAGDGEDRLSDFLQYPLRDRAGAGGQPVGGRSKRIVLALLGAAQAVVLARRAGRLGGGVSSSSVVGARAAMAGLAGIALARPCGCSGSHVAAGGEQGEAEAGDRRIAHHRAAAIAEAGAGGQAENPRPCPRRRRPDLGGGMRPILLLLLALAACGQAPPTAQRGGAGPARLGRAAGAGGADRPARPLPRRQRRAGDRVRGSATAAPASLADFRGRPVLVNLWATWCAPCVAEMPTLDALGGARGRRLQVLTVSQDRDGREQGRGLLRASRAIATSRPGSTRKWR